METSLDKSKEATSEVAEEDEKKVTEVVSSEFQGDAAVTTVSVDVLSILMVILLPFQSTLEFEPSNEPDVPIGPPEVCMFVVQ